MIRPYHLSPKHQKPQPIGICRWCRELALPIAALQNRGTWHKRCFTHPLRPRLRKSSFLPKPVTDSVRSELARLEMADIARRENAAALSSAWLSTPSTDPSFAEQQQWYTAPIALVPKRVVPKVENRFHHGVTVPPKGSIALMVFHSWRSR